MEHVLGLIQEHVVEVSRYFLILIHTIDRLLFYPWTSSPVGLDEAQWDKPPWEHLFGPFISLAEVWPSCSGP